jgi:hypothetical protein
MKSEKARIGMRVRARDSLLRTELRGKNGTVARIWGHPEFSALDVLFDDGGSQLFWHHEWKRLRLAPKQEEDGRGR